MTSYTKHSGPNGNPGVTTCVSVMVNGKRVQGHGQTLLQAMFRTMHKIEERAR